MLPPHPSPPPSASAGLKIAIYSGLDGRTTELLFSEFPVRIGRNRQNDLVLRHEYVSQYHAEVHLIGGQLSIMQVGSSNSVRVDGAKLRPRENLPISGQEEIRMVPFTLRLDLTASPSPERGPTAAVMPADEPPLPDLPGGWDDQPPARPSPGWDQGAAAPAPAPQPPPAPLPVPSAAPAGAAPGQEEAALLDRMAQRYLGRPLASPQDAAQFGLRLEQVLDIFLRFFVAMQRGQVQFYEQMGLPPPEEYLNTAEQSTSSAQLGGMLLNSQDPRSPADLEAAFESLKIHQVAVLRGMEAGVRSLLRRISPGSVSKVAGRLTRSPGVRTLWETFKQMHEDLAEEDQEAFKVIYGGQFRKAYLRLMQAGRQALRGS